MDRLSELQARQEKLAGRMGIRTSMDRKLPSGPQAYVIKVAPGVVLLLLLLAGFFYWLQKRQSNSDEELSRVSARYAQAVGLLVADKPEDSGGRVGLATAWGVAPGLAVSNAHVAVLLESLLAQGIPVSIVVNGTGESLPVAGVSRHPEFRMEEGFYDLALIAVEKDFPLHFALASVSELDRLQAGVRVAYLGFPMENLRDGNVNTAKPVATMQSGIITALSDFNQVDAGTGNNVLIKHNLGVTGGASGSPLFNVNGRVVGVVNAMNMVRQLVLINDKQLAESRSPSAAMVNFAHRIDLLVGVPAPAGRTLPSRGGYCSENSEAMKDVEASTPPPP